MRRLKDDKAARERYKQAARKRAGEAGEGTKGPAGAKVSAALDKSELPKNGKLAPQVRETLDAIDSVHGDGNLPTIPIKATDSDSLMGAYTHSLYDKSSVDIEISAKGEQPMITAAHEVGHFLDHQGVLGNGKWGSMSDMPEMRAVIAATRKSEAIKNLETLKGKGGVRVKIKGKNYVYKADGEHIDYLLTKKETFARAYSQYIAKKSGNLKMLAELNSLRDRKKRHVYYSGQWDDDDFAPIEKEMDNLFGALGWRK